MNVSNETALSAWYCFRHLTPMPSQLLSVVREFCHSICVASKESYTPVKHTHECQKRKLAAVVFACRMSPGPYFSGLSVVIEEGWYRPIFQSYSAQQNKGLNHIAKVNFFDNICISEKKQLRLRHKAIWNQFLQEFQKGLEVVYLQQRN